VKRLLRLLAVTGVLAVFCGGYSDGAWAQQYNHYINCGTGAYIYSYDLVWVGGHWEQRNVQRTQIWGSC
jgi:hypothetical protein